MTLWTEISSPFRAVIVANAEPIKGAPTPKLLAAVTVNTPFVIDTAVAEAEGATVEQLNVNSSTFHHHVKGGDSMVWITRLALVRAGSREFPMTGL